MTAEVSVEKPEPTPVNSNCERKEADRNVQGTFSVSSDSDISAFQLINCITL